MCLDLTRSMFLSCMCVCGTNTICTCVFILHHAPSSSVYLSLKRKATDKSPVFLMFIAMTQDIQSPVFILKEVAD